MNATGGAVLPHPLFPFDEPETSQHKTSGAATIGSSWPFHLWLFTIHQASQMVLKYLIRCKSINNPSGYFRVSAKSLGAISCVLLPVAINENQRYHNFRGWFHISIPSLCLRLGYTALLPSRSSYLRFLFPQRQRLKSPATR